MSTFTKALFTISIFFLINNAQAFNITTILSQYTGFDIFSKYLAKTHVNEEINSRKTITVLAVENNNMSPIEGKTDEEIKKIMRTHVILDYFDVQKLQNLPDKSSILTTLYQASGTAVGKEGFLNCTILGTQTVAFGSAVPGSALGSNLVKSIATQPYNISVLQVSNLIGAKSTAVSPSTSPSPNSSNNGSSPSPNSSNNGSSASPNSSNNGSSLSPNSSNNGSSHSPSSPKAPSVAVPPMASPPKGSMASPPKGLMASSPKGSKTSPSSAPTVNDSTADAPSASSPMADGSPADAPVASSPMANDSVADAPVVSSPAQSPTADGPAADSPDQGSAASSKMGVQIFSYFAVLIAGFEFWGILI